MRTIFFLFFCLATFAADARMYQWVEPGVETTQLSGKPPTWYRSSVGGPRVFVFENGRLIDDTAVQVSDEVRQRMREEAFLLAEEDRKKAEEKIAKAREAEQKRKKLSELDEEDPQIADVDEEESTVELLTDALFPKEEEKEDEETLSASDMDELRSMIADWEASQTESAKQALE